MLGPRLPRLTAAAVLFLLTGLAVAVQDGDPEGTVTTKSGLKYLDLEIGEGPRVRRGDRARVHYTGWLEDGTMFDSTRRQGRTFTFPVGKGRVIRGWDEGLIGMQIGGKRRLVVPPKLAYGKRGAGNVIPPDETLTFEIELIGIEP
ncbi:MAG: FKBP-type peptidyl-prolyl cis-trans isomerase [Thermoanaerobaculia bacterium]|nr:FKBP-type peptidyl-prolyl cis-trans isomerase [Thermoanaerobaculia bacterium]